MSSSLHDPGHAVGPVDIGGGESKTLRLAVPTARAGFVTLERFAIATYHPGRLFRAWTWVHMDARCLVYPTTGAAGPPAAAELGRRWISRSAESRRCRLRRPAHGQRQAIRRSTLPGKHMRGVISCCSSSFPPATTNRSGSSGTLCRSSTSRRSSHNSRGGASTRRREGRSFGLRVPGTTVELGSGQRHLDECLRALALFGIDA